MRISDWSSDVCSSDLAPLDRVQHRPGEAAVDPGAQPRHMHLDPVGAGVEVDPPYGLEQGLARDRATGHAQIGRASCRERVCQYVSISVVAVSLKKTHRVNEVGKKKK